MLFFFLPCVRYRQLGAHSGKPNSMDNLLPRFRPSSQTYYGMHIPLTKTQVEPRGNNRKYKTLGERLLSNSKTTDGLENTKGKVLTERARRSRTSTTMHFLRPFDAVRLQPTLGREPRARPREQIQAANRTGWKFTTSGSHDPGLDSYKERGVMEYDGFEVSVSRPNIVVAPAKVRASAMRDRSLSPPRLTQASNDAVKNDIRGNKSSTASIGGGRQVFNGSSNARGDNSKSPLAKGRRKQRPATAPETRLFPNRHGKPGKLPAWGYKRGGKFKPQFKMQPIRDENAPNPAEPTKEVRKPDPPCEIRLSNLQAVPSTLYLSTAKGKMKIFTVRPGYSLGTNSNVQGAIKLRNLQTAPVSATTARLRQRPASAAASNRQASNMAECQVALPHQGLSLSIVPRNMLKNFRSMDDDVKCTIKFSNHDIQPFQIYWINYEGQCFPRMLLRPGDSYVESSFATHPWFIENANSKNAEGLCFVLGEKSCNTMENYSVVYNPPNRQWKKTGKLSLAISQKSSKPRKSRNRPSSAPALKQGKLGRSAKYNRPTSAKQKLRASIPTNIPVNFSVAIVPNFKL